MIFYPCQRLLYFNLEKLLLNIIYIKIGLQTRSSTSGYHCRSGQLTGMSKLNFIMLKQANQLHFGKKDESKDLLSTLLHIVHDAIIAVDHAQIIVLFNLKAEQIFGYIAAEVIGQPLTLLLPSKIVGNPGIYCTAKCTPHLPTFQQQEVTGRHKKGTPLLLEANVAKVGSEGQLANVIALRDISERKQVEQALQIHEARYRTIVESQMELVCRLLPDGTMTFVNQSYLRYFNKTYAEVIGSIPAERDIEGQAELVQENVAALSVEHPINTFEEYTPAPDGTPRWVQWVDRAIFDQAGRIIEIQAVGRDITAVKQAEAAKAEVQRFYRSLFEQSPDAVFILDLEGRHCEVNLRAAQMLDYTPEEIRQLSVKDLSVQPVESNRTLAQLLAGEPIPPYERLFRKKNGEIIPVEVHLALIRDDKDVPYRIQSIVRDITERKRIEQVVRDREQRLQEIVNAAPFGSHLYELNEDNRLVLIGANRAADLMIGIEHRQWLGKTMEEILPGTINTELPSAFQQVAQQGGSYDNEVCYYADNERRSAFEVHAVQVASNRMVAFFRDVTELAQAYDMALAGWSRAMDLRDQETECHTQRVTTLVVRLARAMGLGDGELVHIRRGALLHDIGKMGIPDQVLLKPDKLTEEEWVIMRKHPDYAYHMLWPIPYLRPALAIPYCHHEKWDGSGYPRGLKGAEIPLAARLFAVVDVWDALCSDRPYRPAWPREKVREHILTLAGSHFDPTVVSTFLQIIEEDKPVYASAQWLQNSQEPLTFFAPLLENQALSPIGRSTMMNVYNNPNACARTTA